MKKLITLFIALLMVLAMTGCTESVVENVDDKQEQQEQTSMFVKIESASTWIVVYHKETKVMYTVSNGYSSYGEFTVLVDADGKPLLYEENN